MEAGEGGHSGSSALKRSENNPLGILAIDHLEFCSNIPWQKSEKTPWGQIDLFRRLGFALTAKNHDESKVLFSQGQIRFLYNTESNHESHAHQYFQKHGEGVCTLSFLVEDAKWAIDEAKRRGGQVIKPLQEQIVEHGNFRTARIRGFGDVEMEFIERPMNHFRADMSNVENDPFHRPLKMRLARIDHLTNNVPRGEMKKWVQYYQQVFGFKVTRYFDIKGTKTGLLSEVVQLEGGAVIIPINEPDDKAGKGQIQEFLDLHKGAGVQHIALTTARITDTIEDLQERQFSFLNIPPTYYQDIKKRGITVDEDLKLLEKRQLLVDGDDHGYLLQNFTKTYVGPLFFEFIQRKNHNGFGEGNFQALFDAIERDQMERGVLK